MPSQRLSMRPRFDRTPIARGLGSVPRRLGKLKSRLAEGDHEERDKEKDLAEGDEEDPENQPQAEMEDGEEDPEQQTEDKDAEGMSGNVDATGGKFGAGIIRRFSVITRGEALGHGFWIDATSLQQVAAAINATGDRGLKSRFTHPSLSGDGMGKLLGRALDAEVDGDRVLADLHLLQSAHETPDGDLAAYVLKLAVEDPEGFGTSIAFEHDEDAELAFYTENEMPIEGRDDQGRPLKGYRFQSPDPQNVNNYWHMRLRELRACDVVDEPAANPQGMFHRETTDLLKEGEALLDFVLGISTKPPALSALAIAPERMKGFAQRYAEERKLRLGVKLSELPSTPAPPADPRAELGRYVQKFGAERGAQWFSEGVEWTAAIERQLGLVEAENVQLKERIQAVKLGEKEPVSFSHPPKDGSPKDGAPKGGGASQLNGSNPNAARYAASLKLQASSRN